MSPDQLSFVPYLLWCIEVVEKTKSGVLLMRNCALLLLAQLHGTVLAFNSFDFICIDKSIRFKQQCQQDVNYASRKRREDVA